VKLPRVTVVHFNRLERIWDNEVDLVKGREGGLTAGEGGAQAIFVEKALTDVSLEAL
jgi:hypothetical protein